MLSDPKLLWRVRQSLSDFEAGNVRELAKEEALAVINRAQRAKPLFSVSWSASAQRDLTTLPEQVATAVVELSCGGLAENPAGLGMS